MRKLFTNFVWGLTGESQSMLVDSGRVVQRLPQTIASFEAEESFDLGGRYMLPSFVDAHCHILPTGLDLQKLHLGGCKTRDEILELVREAHQNLPEDKWLQAVHYDQTRFPDSVHLTKDSLDKISSQRPILLRHISGHASVANSAALCLAGVQESSPDPPGGVFGRDEHGSLNGQLLEKAHEYVTAAAPPPTLEEMTKAILLAGEKMANLGIGSASDMLTGRWSLAQELEAYRLASEQGCRVRLRLYITWSKLFGPKAIDQALFTNLTNAMTQERCRVAGVKIFADGAIGAATAAIYGRYTSGYKSSLNDQDEEVSGQLIYPPARLNEMVRLAHEAGWPIAIHSIGDYSTDVVMDAYEALDEPGRHRVEHAMLLSDSQIERLRRLGCTVCSQPEFLSHFQHAYFKQLAPERARQIKRARSLLKAGVPLAFSSDRPIVPGDPWAGIRAAQSRPEPYDPVENISRQEALTAYTLDAAKANGDPDLGHLEPGALADFQLYSEDPLSAKDPRPLAQGAPLKPTSV